MKYCVIVPDGMADYPVAQWKNRTPLAAARTPNLDAVSAEGRLGRVQTIPRPTRERALPCLSDVAILSILGYDPKVHYTGRAPLEVLAMGLDLHPEETAFRCNLITVSEGVVADNCAGHVSTKEAEVLLALLEKEVASLGVRFHHEAAYRSVMICRVSDPEQIECAPPHEVLGERIEDHVPRGGGSDLLVHVMRKSFELFDGHDINNVRIDLGENPANMAWLWGHGQRPRMPSFEKQFGLKGAVVCAVAHVRGLAMAVGWDVVDVPGATGYYDTNYEAKGEAAVRALEDHDIVLVHVEATDEAGHAGDAEQKKACIERVDAAIIGPVVKRLREFGEWRLMVLPDHFTPVAERTHTRAPVPFLIAGTGIVSVLSAPFTEAAAERSDLSIAYGHELMPYFLRP